MPGNSDDESIKISYIKIRKMPGRIIKSASQLLAIHSTGLSSANQSRSRWARFHTAKRSCKTSWRPCHGGIVGPLPLVSCILPSPTGRWPLPLRGTVCDSQTIFDLAPRVETAPRTQVGVDYTLVKATTNDLNDNKKNNR